MPRSVEAPRVDLATVSETELLADLEYFETAWAITFSKKLPKWETTLEHLARALACLRRELRAESFDESLFREGGTFLDFVRRPVLGRRA